MSSPASSSGRPLSPHLTVYKMIPTMLASIMHRMTGVALYFGTILVAIWLIAAASGPGAFGVVNAVYSSWFGLLILFGYTWVLMHHMLGGVRHFLWDATVLMDKQTATKLAYATFIGSAGLTVLIWLIVALGR
ncbi:MAG: succinate dehydrogenase, cytochrome b556 subunit [Pseudomonadota bacterium]